MKVKGKFNSWCVYFVQLTIYIVKCTKLLRFNLIWHAQLRFRDCIFKISTGFQRLNGGLGVCNTAIGPDKNNCCVPLWYISTITSASFVSCTAVLMSLALGYDLKKMTVNLSLLWLTLELGDDWRVVVLLCIMMNRHTACSNLPWGSAVKLTSFAGWCCPLGQSQCCFCKKKADTASVSQWRQFLGGLFVWGRGVDGEQVHQIN